ALNVTVVLDGGGHELKRQRGCGGLSIAHEVAVNGTPGIGHQSNADEGWRYLLEKGQPLADDALLILQQSSEITVWPRQIANEARADWVGDVDKNDRDHARFSMQGAGSLPGMCEHHFWPQRHQLFRQRWSLVAGRRKPNIHMEIATLRPSEPLQ